MAGFARISGPEPRRALRCPGRSRLLSRLAPWHLLGRSRSTRRRRDRGGPASGPAAGGPGCAGRLAAGPAPQRTHQHVRHLRRTLRPQDVSPGRGGRQPRPGDRPLSSAPGETITGSPRSSASSNTDVEGRSRSRWASSIATSPTREPPGSTPSISSASTSSGWRPSRANRYPPPARRPAIAGRSLRELIGGYLDTARLLGLRTAELHRTLAANRTDPAFAPEPFGKLYQRSLYQSLRNLTGRLCDRLSLTQERHTPGSPTPGRAGPRAARRRSSQRFRAILDPSFAGKRIRCHGDYHLGQLLFTGKDFVIIDFEGETARPIGERRVKRVPAARRRQHGPLAGLRRPERPPGLDRRARPPARNDPPRGSAGPGGLGQLLVRTRRRGNSSRPISRPSSRRDCSRARWRHATASSNSSCWRSHSSRSMPS